jgi:N-acetyl-1-D-myo-inositol-2-amino-2-deoxy-alpha-D-glucopyranoside deacetylase
MVWGEHGRAVAAPDVPDGAFALADVDDAAAHLVRVLREVRPQVLVTYEPGGGYGHPDHVQAHRVALRAVEPAAADGGAGAPWDVAKVYETVVPRSAARDVLHGRAEQNPFSAPPADAALPSLVVDDAEVTTVVEAQALMAAKAAALRAHATQVDVRDGWFALSHGVGQPATGTEWYRLVKGTPSPDPHRADGRESDLFAGTV